jgi:hypothetical protein
MTRGTYNLMLKRLSLCLLQARVRSFELQAFIPPYTTVDQTDALCTPQHWETLRTWQMRAVQPGLRRFAGTPQEIALWVLLPALRFLWTGLLACHCGTPAKNARGLSHHQLKSGCGSNGGENTSTHRPRPPRHPQGPLRRSQRISRRPAPSYTSPSAPTHSHSHQSIQAVPTAFEFDSRSENSTEDAPYTPSTHSSPHRTLHRVPERRQRSQSLPTAPSATRLENEEGNKVSSSLNPGWRGWRRGPVQ